MLRVHEIYHSLQGEGQHAGLPCSFIRLTGCPLRCKWCDTAHAFEGGQELEAAAILKKVKELNTPPSASCQKHRPLVLVTGGEPLAQKEAPALMNELNKSGYQVLLETSGSEPISKVPSCVHILMDLKCPDSKMSEHNLWENLDHLKPTDEIKFVVASKDDFNWAHTICLEKNLYKKNGVLFSAAWGLVKEEALSEWMLEAKCFARLNLQQHKFIWGPRKKGV